MGDEIKGKKRVSINLSFLTLTDSTKQNTTPHKSTKIFEDPNGVVGLGILAAMNGHQDPVFINGCRTAITPKSPSIPIPNKSSELSCEEEYTCVVSKKDTNIWVNTNEFVITGSFMSTQVADFLSCCFLCNKLLHGLDIFMYRGEKAFCSAECRLSQISIDEHKEKKRSSSGVRKKSMEYSVSPLQFLAGVAAA